MFPNLFVQICSFSLGLGQGWPTFCTPCANFSKR